jgi:hypothetical protein
MKSKYQLLVQANKVKHEADMAIKPYRIRSQRAKAENPSIIPPWECAEHNWESVAMATPKKDNPKPKVKSLDFTNPPELEPSDDWRKGPLGQSEPKPVPKPDWYEGA